jgi:hypothetical protein
MMPTLTAQTNYSVHTNNKTYSICDDNNGKELINNILIKECAHKLVGLLNQNNTMRIVNLLELHSQYEHYKSDHEYYNQIIKNKDADSANYYLYYDRAENAEMLMESVYKRIKMY